MVARCTFFRASPDSACVSNGSAVAETRGGQDYQRVRAAGNASRWEQRRRGADRAEGQGFLYHQGPERGSPPATNQRRRRHPNKSLSAHRGQRFPMQTSACLVVPIRATQTPRASDTSTPPTTARPLPRPGIGRAARSASRLGMQASQLRRHRHVRVHAHVCAVPAAGPEPRPEPEQRKRHGQARHRHEAEDAQRPRARDVGESCGACELLLSSASLHAREPTYLGQSPAGQCPRRECAHRRPP